MKKYKKHIAAAAELVPPPNFAKVEDGIYRSALPSELNFTIFVRGAYPEENLNLSGPGIFDFSSLGLKEQRCEKSSSSDPLQARKASNRLPCCLPEETTKLIPNSALREKSSTQIDGVRFGGLSFHLCQLYPYAESEYELAVPQMLIHMCKMPPLSNEQRYWLTKGFLHAQGTTPAEVAAVEAAGELLGGSTAYLNMEPGDCHGDDSAISAIVKAGITRVVVGMRNPLHHLRGAGIRALRGEGLQVDVLGEDLQSKLFEDALKSCRIVNAPLLYRAASRVPFSVLKYAMTLDARCPGGRVFELLGRSDAVIVGGNTVRRDNPRLTARHGGQHVPVRIVMSQTLNLPECGGSLAAPAISAGVIHKVYAFVAPKVIGGKHAPTPVGELGMVEMTQALDLLDVNYEQIGQAFWGHGLENLLSSQTTDMVGPDMLVSGFFSQFQTWLLLFHQLNETFAIDPSVSQFESKIIFFYKTWDPYGALSNFSHHPIQMPDDKLAMSVTWQSVEHYYQANKFTGVNDPMALECLTSIKSAASPEKAARKGRTLQSSTLRW
ncbi:unnamed protein product [Rhodiola kirilowii]